MITFEAGKTAGCFFRTYSDASEPMTKRAERRDHLNVPRRNHQTLANGTGNSRTNGAATHCRKTMNQENLSAYFERNLESCSKILFPNSLQKPWCLSPRFGEADCRQQPARDESYRPLPPMSLKLQTTRVRRIATALLHGSSPNTPTLLVVPTYTLPFITTGVMNLLPVPN